MNFKKQYAALGIPDCPEDAFQPEGKRLKLHGGGGGGQPSNTTQTTIPEWARPYAENMLATSQGQVYQFNPEGQITGLKGYQPYGGQLTAGSSPLQQQAAAGAAGMKTPGQFTQGSNLAQAGGIAALQGSQGYNPAAFNGGGWNATTRDQYMSPYTQGVTDIATREALRNAAIQGTQRQAKFAQAGAFGGSRQALADTEAQRNLNQNLADIQAKGLESAYNTGLQAYQSDAARQLQAQQMGEQSRQFGSTLGLQGAQTAAQAGQTLGQLGTQQAQAQQDIIKTQAGIGQQQQQTAQAAIDAQMQQYTNAQNYPYKQLGFLSDMLHGLPLANTSVYQAAPSPMSQMAGMGLAGLGLYNSMK